MKFLELEIQRKIYNTIAKKPGLSINEIAKSTKKEIPLIERHLRHMKKDGLIIAIKQKNNILYDIGNYQAVSKTKQILITRKRIYDLIIKNPGLHLSKIAESLNIRISLVEYHLQYMERDGLITVNKENGYSRYYVGGSEVGVKDKKIISLLRQETPLKIVLFLLKNPNSRHAIIAEKLGMTTAALSYHLNKLVEYEIVSKPDSIKAEWYNIKNKKNIKSLLRRYKLQTVIERFTEAWQDFN
jgi:predicted transcriptional regulator